MSKKIDAIAKIFTSRNDIFADIVNYTIFDGKEVVLPSNLKNIDTNYVERKELHEKTRDVLKDAIIKSDNKSYYAIFGIENQTKKDKKMVLRVADYDIQEYLKQFDNISKNGIMKPVITIVVHYGKKRWNEPKSLHELLKIKDEHIKRFVPNYFINVIEPYFMKDEDIEKLKSDFKFFSDFYRSCDDVNKIEDLSYKYKDNINKNTVEFINYMTDAKLEYDEDEEEFNMCKGMDDFRNKYEEKGKQAGILEGSTETLNQNIINLYDGGFTKEDISRGLKVDISYVEQVLESK